MSGLYRVSVCYLEIQCSACNLVGSSFLCVCVSNPLLLPEKHSRKSCSSLRARSIPFLACSSVRRVLISLFTSRRKKKNHYKTHGSMICSIFNVLSPCILKCRLWRNIGSTHRTFSSDLGLTKMAMGWSWAACSLRTALADTSKMQCFPCCLFTHAEGRKDMGLIKKKNLLFW